MVWRFKPIAFSARPVLELLCVLEDGKQTDDHGEEGNTFDESGSDNHSGTDSTSGFGLTCNAFHCALTDFADTETGTDGGKTCANTGTEYTDEFSCISSHFQEDV
jgi:hypothetical protein